MKTITIRKEEIDRLADHCCEAFEVNIEDFYQYSRRRKPVDARRAFFHIIKTFYGMNELEISNSTPINLHRTTIMFAVDTADDCIEFDSDFRNKYSKVYKRYTGDDYSRSERLKRRLIKQSNRVQ
jgi:chromosomal replication initiation ATPase DnaA